MLELAQRPDRLLSAVNPSLRLCANLFKKIVELLLLIIVILILYPENIEANKSPHYVTVVFRYDDYCSRSDTELEKRIIADFKKHNVCCTFSIIPFVKAKNYLEFEPQDIIPLTPEKIAIARDAIKAGAMDAAQHGYSHQTLQTKGWHTEFQTLDYSTQMDKLTKGKAFLEKVLDKPIITFVPPYNAYDAITIEVLEKLNFQCLSAGMEGEPVPSTSLEILPGTCNLGNLRNTIEYARKIVDYDPIICVVFHQYVFTDVETATEQEDINYKMSYDKFSELLSWVASQKDIRIMSIDQILKTKVNLSMDRFINNKYYLQLVHLKPAWWPPHYGIYLPADTASNIRFRNFKALFNITRMRNILYIASFYFMILIIVFLITYIVGTIAFAVSKEMDKICKYYSLIMLCILLSYLAFGKIQYKNLEVIVGLWGLGLGGWMVFFKRKKFMESKEKRQVRG
jgi:peptidoglycan/xylan/chitin deacetylase (PgdA/CDA1 family)